VKAFSLIDGTSVKITRPVTVSDSVSDIAVVDDSAVVKKVFRLKNTSTRRVAGSLSLKVPDGWQVKSKSGLAFSIPPSASADVSAKLVSPVNAKVGRYTGESSVSVGREAFAPSPMEIEIPVLCPKRQAEIRVDGDLSDWPERLPIAISASADTQDGPKDEADLSCRAAASWDDKFLYLALKVTDDRFLQEKEGPETWRQDSVQVAFDTLRDRSTGGFEDDDYEYGFALTPSEVLCWRFACPPGKLLGRVQVRTAIVRSGTVTNYEAAIPWSELAPFVPRTGRTMGVSILVNDDDGNGRRILEFGGGIVSQKQPNRFMGLRLTGG
jgi:hypothetical protein